MQKESRRKETKSRTESWNKEIGQKNKENQWNQKLALFKDQQNSEKKLRAVPIMNIKLGVKQ